MSEKENMKPNGHETLPQMSNLKKQQGRYSSEKNKKVTPKVNKGETGQRGKKQRREFKLEPNRG